MLTDKEIQHIMYDLGQTLKEENIIHERVNKVYEWIDITLKEHMELTSNDFPHLLTIAKNYGLHITVYVYGLGQLGIFLRR